MEFLRILEEYRAKCEAEGNYLEAGRAAEQLETLRKQVRCCGAMRCFVMCGARGHVGVVVREGRGVLMWEPGLCEGRYCLRSPLSLLQCCCVCVLVVVTLEFTTAWHFCRRDYRCTAYWRGCVSGGAASNQGHARTAAG